MNTNSQQISTEQTIGADLTTTVSTIPPKNLEKRKYAKKQASAQPKAAAPIVAPIIAAAVQSALPTPAASLSNTINISSLRIATNFGDRMSVKKITVNVPVGKPKKSSFFRVKSGEESEFLAYIFENKESGETFLLSQDMADIVPESVRPVRLYVATDRRGNPMLIPLPLPGEDGRRNPWHESLGQAIERAKTRWVRVVANMSAGANDVLEAQAELGDPEWTEHSIEQLIEIAFRGKIITDESHAVIQELLGRV